MTWGILNACCCSAQFWYADRNLGSWLAKYLRCIQICFARAMRCADIREPSTQAPHFPVARTESWAVCNETVGARTETGPPNQARLMSQEMGYHWGKVDAPEIFPKLQQANGATLTGPIDQPEKPNTVQRSMASGTFQTTAEPYPRMNQNQARHSRFQAVRLRTE